MHWILQDNLFNEAAYQVLLETLERFELPHSVHKVVPFVGELLPEPELSTKNVMCMGSYSLRHAAKKYGWNPGVFDLEPMDFKVQRTIWGQEMLNADSKVVKFKDASFGDHEDLFIRPIQDSKVFAGKVFQREEFEDWQRKVVVLEHDYGNSLTKDTLIQVSPPKVIYVEARFWIVKGEIVTSSIYKRGKRVEYSTEVPNCYHRYVYKMLAAWQKRTNGKLPHDAFVIDIADTPEGMKIVEINTLNSCGFYAADIQKLVMALENGFNQENP